MANRRDIVLIILLGSLGFFAAHYAQEPAATAPREKTSTAPSRIDPKAQELLDQAVEALGGSAFREAKNIVTRGRTFAIAEEATAGFAPFESTVAFPDKRRFSYGKNKPVTLINDGQRGWQLDRYGMIRQKPEQLHRWRIGSRYGYENLLRQVIREGGLLIQEAGRDFTDNLPARVVDLTDAQQVRVRLHLHAVTALPIRVTYRVQNPESREWEEFAEVYGDYRKVQDIQTPMHITRFLNGERYSELFRSSVQYNQELPPNYFTPGG